MNNDTDKTAEEALKPKWGKSLTLLSNCIFFFTCLAFAIYLAELAYEGFFARFIADDFCYVNPAIQDGLFQGFLHFYNKWSGRFSAIFLTQLGSITGRFFPSILPTLLITGLSTSLYYFYQQFFLVFGSTKVKRFAILPTFATLFFFLLLTPNRYQILDWVNGSITYTGPLIVMVTLITWLIYTWRFPAIKKPWLTGLGIFFLALIGAGFSETNTALLISSLVVLCLLSLVFTKKLNRWQPIRWQLLALAGSISGLVVMVLAPGNDIRKGTRIQVAPNLLALVIASTSYAWDFTIDMFKSKPLPVVILVSFFIIIGFITISKGRHFNPGIIKRSKLPPLVLIPIINLVLLISVMAPSVYFQSAFPARRTLSGATFILVLSLAGLGFFIGKLLRLLIIRLNPQWQKTLMICSLLGVLILSIYPIRAALINIPEVQATIQFGRAWDMRHMIITTAVFEQHLDLLVPDINSQHGLQDVDDDPMYWVNQCMAEYYGLNSLKTKY